MIKHNSPQNWGQITIKLGTKRVIQQQLILCRKKKYIYIYMLTGLKMSSLACKCIFSRSEHNTKGDPMELNFEGREIQI